jgi:hypothetical protein
MRYTLLVGWRYDTTHKRILCLYMHIAIFSLQLVQPVHVLSFPRFKHKYNFMVGIAEDQGATRRHTTPNPQSAESPNFR